MNFIAKSIHKLNYGFLHMRVPVGVCIYAYLGKIHFIISSLSYLILDVSVSNLKALLISSTVQC